MEEKKCGSEFYGSFSTITGDDAGTWLLIAGEQSIPVPRKSRNSIPKYADDVTSHAPRMLVPSIATSNDHGNTWQRARLPGEIGPLEQLVVSGSSAVAIGPYAVLTTEDKGRSWFDPKENGIEETTEEAYPLSAAIFGKRVWLSLKNGTVLTGEIAKHELTPVKKSSEPLGDLAFIDSCVGFALGENDDLETTADAGATWREVTNSERVIAFSTSKSGILAATHDHILQISMPQSQSTSGCGK